MILVDSSVWIAALRRKESQEARHLVELLDEDQVALASPVRLELLAGASAADLPRVRRALSALPLLVPGSQTWTRAESWIKVATAAGERFGVVDLLIGALATEREAALWSLDSDYARMSRLGLVKLHQPPAN